MHRTNLVGIHQEYVKFFTLSVRTLSPPILWCGVFGGRVVTGRRTNIGSDPSFGNSGTTSTDSTPTGATSTASFTTDDEGQLIDGHLTVGQVIFGNAFWIFLSISNGFGRLNGGGGGVTSLRTNVGGCNSSSDDRDV